VRRATFEFFLELGDYALRHHPPDIWINASTLARTGVVGPGPRVEPRTLRRRLAQAGGPTWAYLREAARRGGERPQGGRERVLAALPFDRSDYVGFLAPVLAGLSEAGVRCGVLTTRAGLAPWRDPAAHLGVPLRPLDAALEPGVHRDTRRLLAALGPSLADLAAHFRLAGPARAALRGYFVEYAFDKVLAGRHLERHAPEVVLGIHFVARRGWQGALHEAASRGRKATVLLMQHGAFAADEAFHDFEGADVALVWGERWRRELLRFADLPFAPRPAVAVGGNPKYDAPAPEPSPRRAGGTPRVLYVSNHGGDHATLLEPLRAAIAASRRGDGFDLLVRLHPEEARGAVQGLIAAGALGAGQVAPPGGDLADAILAADVVVGPPSTTLFEAARLGRPVVVVAERPPTIFEGFAATSDPEALAEAVGRSGAAAGAAARARAATLVDLFGPVGGACGTTVALVREHL